MTAPDRPGDHADEVEPPTEPTAGDGENPTDPLPAGDESPTRPISDGGEEPTEPIPAGGQEPTEPLSAGAGGSRPGTGDDHLPGVWILAGSIAAAVLLVGVYLAAGGLDFKPAAAADPCDAREWGDPQGLEQTAERFSLSAIDGAACQLGVSREELTRALATEQNRIHFGEVNGLSDAEIEDAIRSGLMRAIDDGENAGAISGIAASGLRLTVRVMPVSAMAALALDASELFQEGGTDAIGNLIDGALGALDELGSGDPGGGSGGGSGNGARGGDSGGGSGGRSGGAGGRGSGGESGLDELERQLRDNIPDQIPPELEDQIQQGLDGLFGP